MLNNEYPPIEAFLPPNWKPDDCGCKAAKMRAARGKKKNTREDPGCYGADCGSRVRRCIDALTCAVRNSVPQ